MESYNLNLACKDLGSDQANILKGRCIRGIKDGFELRESQSAYNAIFDPENCDIAPEKT